MNGFSRFLPWIVVGLAALYLLVMMLPPSQETGKMHLDDFAKLPVVDGGRVKPIDSVARTDLMIVSSKQTFTSPDGTPQARTASKNERGISWRPPGTR